MGRRPGPGLNPQRRGHVAPNLPALVGTLPFGTGRRSALYERPGWWFRGRCWWWTYLHTPWLSKEDEIRYLEELKKYITDVVLKEIDKRLEELRSGGQGP